MKEVLGIDPGLSGALALYEPVGGPAMSISVYADLPGCAGKYRFASANRLCGRYHVGHKERG